MPKWIEKFKSYFRRREGRLRSLQTFREFAEPVKPWWGTFHVEEGQTRFWRVGNMVVCVDRFTNEWHIASCPISQVQQPEEESTEDTTFQVPIEELVFKTFTFKTQAEITLTPVLPNRSLASKLERPFFIPGGEEIILYVSSPVWIRVSTGTTNIILDEIPTFFLSDTWFGENFIEGELCYAGHTYCSTHLREIPSGPDRIISPMLIRNDSSLMLPIEKISVPLPNLSVYSDEQNYLWTEQLTVHREGDDHPKVRVKKGPPKAIASLERRSPPRADYTPGIRRLFTDIMGH